MADTLIVLDTEPTIIHVGMGDSVVETSVAGDTLIVTSDDPVSIISVGVEDTVVVVPDTIINVDVLTVGEQGPAGPPGQGSEIFEQRAEIVSDYSVYRGEAALGTTDEAAPVWRVRKIEILYGVVLAATTTWAEGSTGFTHAWADRHSYTYS